MCKKNIIFILLILQICSFCSCEKDDSKEQTEAKEETPDVETALLDEKSIEGVWTIDGFEDKMFRFSFFGDGTGEALLHGSTNRFLYTVEKHDEYYNIRLDVPKVGAKLEKDFIVLHAKSFNGKDHLEGVEIYIKGTPHQAGYTLTKKDLIRFDKDFFNISWSVTSNDMQVENGTIKAFTFTQEGEFEGVTSAGNEVVGEFNKKNFILLVETKYNINDFELSFISFENEAKTKMKVLFRDFQKQKGVILYIERKN